MSFTRSPCGAQHVAMFKEWVQSRQLSSPTCHHLSLTPRSFGYTTLTRCTRCSHLDFLVSWKPSTSKSASLKQRCRMSSPHFKSIWSAQQATPRNGTSRSLPTACLFRRSCGYGMCSCWKDMMSTLPSLSPSCGFIKTISRAPPQTLRLCSASSLGSSFLKTKTCCLAG